ncbi:hypothetical protein BJV74DRAFT_588551 [Russula compacta]|nr:hypothetical protein BJV74DRAFT_588551 [Russula compacta]
MNLSHVATIRRMRLSSLAFHLRKSYFSPGFKSDFIYRQMQKWFDHLREVERESLYSLCKGMGSLGGGLAGFLFEGFAIQNTCRYSPTNDANTPIRHFGRMTKVETTSKKWPNRFIYRANDTRMISTSSSDNPELQVSPSDVLPVVADGASSAFPWTLRDRVTYDKIEDIGMDNSTYYCPHRQDNPLFDAFFFSVGHGKVVIWILQMTIAHTHDGARSGFDLVSSLRKRASDAWREHLVEIKYVLIVPHVDSPCHVEWKFAAEFEAHEGEVYVQFLDVSVFHSVFQRNRDTIIPEIFGVRPEEAAVVEAGVPGQTGQGSTARGAKRRKAERRIKSVVLHFHSILPRIINIAT